MTLQEQTIMKLLMEGKLKTYDVINLDNINFYLKYGSNIVKHNEVPTLTTNCAVAVVIGGNE